MKKRTLFTAGLLAASLGQASQSSAQYLNEHTGMRQVEQRTLCLKVDTLTISAMAPNGFAESVVGLKIDTSVDSREMLVEPNYKTKTCETGYVKITTTAPLMSLRNAPVGL